MNLHVFAWGGNFFRKIRHRSGRYLGFQAGKWFSRKWYVAYVAMVSRTVLQGSFDDTLAVTEDFLCSLSCPGSASHVDGQSSVGSPDTTGVTQLVSDWDTDQVRNTLADSSQTH